MCGRLESGELPAALMKVLPDRIGLFPRHHVLPGQSTIPLSRTALPPQHYKALGGRQKWVFEEMTAAKIRLALPLKGVFVVKMRVTAGRRRAPERFDKQPKVQSARGKLSSAQKLTF